MLDRKDIHNSAMLKPQLTRQQQKCTHAYVAMADTIREQCLNCGKIRLIKREHQNGLHRRYPSQ